MNAPAVTAGLILAGGLGSRMDYRNKGLQLLHQQPLVQHVIQRIQPQLDYLAISANRDLADYQQFDLPIFCDEAPWLEIGPLGGILSAVKHFPAELEWIQIVPCDTPFLPLNLVEKLRQPLLADPTLQVSYVITAERQHPSIFLFKRQMFASLEPLLQQGGKNSLRSWLFQAPYAEVLFAEEALFANVNDATMLHYYNQQC